MKRFMQLRRGDEISVMGRPTQVGDRVVIWADEITADGEQFQIERDQGQQQQPAN